MENASFSKLAQSVFTLNQSLDHLRELAEACGVPSPEHRDWYALLKHKLIPQLSDKAFLIVAVTGGTNTGKSLVFNHLVDEHCSAVDFRASGTKHPVCVVPQSNDKTSLEQVLSRHFESFRLIPWSDAEQPLAENESNFLFWREGKNIPECLLLLDTPDIDSDREINWGRARAIRHAADVLVAVLTEQKYNDAAVRRFFREAAEADKPIVVLFNMFDPEEDVKHLPRWIDRFCEEIKTRPFAVFVAPHDRQRAERLELPFFPAEPDGTNPNFDEPTDLAKVLTELHFDAIKSQTLSGALKILDDPETGVRSYLEEVRATSRRFAEALATLENVGETAVDWPGLPSILLVDEIRSWWNDGRPAWSQNVNAVYRTVGRGLLWPVRKATNYISRNYLEGKTESGNPLDEFQKSENQAVFQFIQKMIRRLENLAETDNPVLRRELLELVGGEHRAALIDRAHKVLASLDPVDDDFRATLRRHLAEWSGENPQTVGWIRSLDHVATVVRPVITVTLAVSGFALGAQVLSSVVGEAAVAGGVTAGGEAMLQAGSEGVQRNTAKLFRKIQEEYVVARSKRFYAEFQKELWKDVIDRLRTGSTVADSDVFEKCMNWRAE